MSKKDSATVSHPHFLGSISSFCPETDNIESYLEIFDLFIKNNGIAAASAPGYLLTLIGSEVYETVKSLCSPDLPSSKSYKEIRSLLKTHFSPQTLPAVERIKFRSCKQGDLKVSEFSVQLKMASKRCNFGANLDENLRDQFIYGLSEQRITRRLLGEQDLTFSKAVQIAAAMELADSEASFLKDESKSGPRFVPNEEVNAVKNDQRRSQSQQKRQSRSGQSEESQNSPSRGRRQGRESRQGQDRGYSRQSEPCRRCGRLPPHDPSRCPAKEWDCYTCGKKGHTSVVCRQQNVNEVTEYVMNVPSPEVTSPCALPRDPCMKTVNLNGKDICLEVDTGASVTLLSHQHWKEIGRPPTKRSRTVLRSVSGQIIDIMGEIVVNVNYKGPIFKCFVLQENNVSKSLLGRGWLNYLFPDWKNAFCDAIIVSKPMSNSVMSVSELESNEVVKKLRSQYPNVFNVDDSPIKGIEASVSLVAGTVPVFRKAYKLPYAIEGVVEQKLRSLVKSGVLEPVKHSLWASPIVCVPKGESDYRICFDYKMTVNPYLLRDVYPLPSAEDIFAKLGNATFFCVVDLTNAYQQLKVDEPSQDILTVNTSLGLFRVKKLPFGIATASHIFQSRIDRILEGIEDACAYQDDIIIGGKTKARCQETLFKVFDRLSQYNVKINLAKCQFLVPQCEYLGHELSANCIKPTLSKCTAIANAPTPTDVTKLLSWLGLVNYYRMFLPNIADTLSPLYELTKKNVKWQWSDECQKAFDATKEALVNCSGLTYYDPSKPIILTCDSSGYGVGAVLSIMVDKKTERPVFFHSCTLNDTQKRYSNLEREALAIVVAVKKFHKYLFGRKFLIRTDHRCLEYIFNPGKGVPAMTAAKLQRWSLFLSSYDYELEYVAGSSIGNADGLSRNPVNDENDVEDICGFSVVDDLPVTCVEIRKESEKDPVLSKVIRSLSHGWHPSYKKNVDLREYFLIREELSVLDGILLRDHKVVVPSCLRQSVLKLLHEGHPGVTRMKMHARAVVWWPGVTNEIEQMVNTCHNCQTTRSVKATKVQAVWQRPNRFFDRVHIDFFEKNRVKYLVLVDAFSGWIECWIMNKTDAAAVIRRLRTCFAQLGLPRLVIADNGPPLASAELTKFFDVNGIQLKHSPPFHPKSNGMAERGVRVCKEMLEREGLDKSLPAGQPQLDNILFNYRVTPRSNGKSPYELVFQRVPNTRLSLLYPIKSDMETFKTPLFEDKQQVYVYNAPKWVRGVIVSKNSPTTYYVECNGRQRLYHVDHIKAVA